MARDATRAHQAWHPAPHRGHRASGDRGHVWPRQLHGKGPRTKPCIGERVPEIMHKLLVWTPGPYLLFPLPCPNLMQRIVKVSGKRWEGSGTTRADPRKWAMVNCSAGTMCWCPAVVGDAIASPHGELSVHESPATRLDNRQTDLTRKLRHIPARQLC